MGRSIFAGLIVIVSVEGALVLIEAHTALLFCSGLATLVVLLVWLHGATEETQVESASVFANPATEMLTSWRARAESMASWAEGTKGDWDRHIRPALSDDLRRLLGSRTQHVNARGPELLGDMWPWVDPQNVGNPGAPGPGRAGFIRILDTLADLR